MLLQTPQCQLTESLYQIYFIAALSCFKLCSNDDGCGGTPDAGPHVPPAGAAPAFSGPQAPVARCGRPCSRRCIAYTQLRRQRQQDTALAHVRFRAAPRQDGLECGELRRQVWACRSPDRHRGVRAVDTSRRSVVSRSVDYTLYGEGDCTVTWRPISDPGEAGQDGVCLGTGEERRSAACLPHGSARGAWGSPDGVIVYSRASTCVSAASV